MRVDTNTVLVVALSSLLLSFIAAVIQDAHAVNNTETLARVSEVVELGTPFLVQHYQTDVGKPQPLDKTSTGNFTGKGIINGNLSIMLQETPLRLLEIVTLPLSKEIQSL